LQLFFSFARAANRGCTPLAIDLDLETEGVMYKKNSSEEIVMKNTMYPVARVLCLNKFRRLPTGKRYHLQTVTVGEMANDLASSVES